MAAIVCIKNVWCSSHVIRFISKYENVYERKKSYNILFWPLWYLDSCRFKAFNEEQYFWQKVHSYPLVVTCLASTCLYTLSLRVEDQLHTLQCQFLSDLYILDSTSWSIDENTSAMIMLKGLQIVNVDRNYCNKGLISHHDAKSFLYYVYTLFLTTLYLLKFRSNCHFV